FVLDFLRANDRLPGQGVIDRQRNRELDLRGLAGVETRCVDRQKTQRDIELVFQQLDFQCAGRCRPEEVEHDIRVSLTQATQETGELRLTGPAGVTDT